MPWAEVDAREEARPDAAGDPAGDPAVAARVQQLADEQRRAGFALQRPPLLRFLLIRTGPERHTLVFTCHHILLDGWSMPLLARELAALAAQAGADGPGAAAALPPPVRTATTWPGCAPADTTAARRAGTPRSTGSTGRR